MRFQWWKNPDEMSVEELYAKMDECTKRANHHDAQDRPLLAASARRKATIAGEELNQRNKWNRITTMAELLREEAKRVGFIG